MGKEFMSCRGMGQTSSSLQWAPAGAPRASLQIGWWRAVEECGMTSGGFRAGGWSGTEDAAACIAAIQWRKQQHREAAAAHKSQQQHESKQQAQQQQHRQVRRSPLSMRSAEASVLVAKNCRPEYRVELGRSRAVCSTGVKPHLQQHAVLQQLAPAQECSSRCTKQTWKMDSMQRAEMSSQLRKPRA